jgi:hypothetical protein
MSQKLLQRRLQRDNLGFISSPRRIRNRKDVEQQETKKLIPEMHETHEAAKPQPNEINHGAHGVHGAKRKSFCLLQRISGK